MYMWLAVLATAIWVLIDAKNIGVKKGLVSGIGDIGPWGWFFVILLLWIVGFPMYLYYRAKYKLVIASSTHSVSATISESVKTTQSQSMAIEDLEKLAVLKGKGLVTEGEFEAKKKQLLGL